MVRTVERALVVEDNRALSRTFAELLRSHFPQVRAAASVGEARAACEGWQPDLIVLDVALPDGTGIDVLRHLERRPAPAVVAVSAEAEPAQAFELARMGVRVYLPKPVSLPSFEAALKEALETAPDMTASIRQAVGHRPLHEVEGQVRETMVEEALARSGHSCRGAARLLDVSRQLLQHILHRFR